MIKSILTQTKIMLNKKGFMFGFSAMMMICLLEVVFSSYGVTALRMEGDGFPGNDPSSVITSFEAFILCVPSGLLSYLELLFPFLCALPFSFSILTDKAANTDTLLCAYCGKRRYIISKITAAFIGSFLIFFVPLMITAVLIISSSIIPWEQIYSTRTGVLTASALCVPQTTPMLPLENCWRLRPFCTVCFMLLCFL